MRKIICPYSKKGIWITREILDEIRTKELLKVPIIITAIPVDFNIRGNSCIKVNDRLLHGHYFENNKGGFIFTPNYSHMSNIKPDWLSHPLFPDWVNGHGVNL